MGKRPEGTSLHRVRNNLGYSPNNCVYATPFEQATNQRRTRQLSAAGRTSSLAEWSRTTGIPAATIASRLRKGVPLAVALELLAPEPEEHVFADLLKAG
jgi:hypothetical protein